MTHSKIAKAFTNPIVFIDTSELMKTVANDGADQNENRVVNKTEIEIVYELCRIFFKVNIFFFLIILSLIISSFLLF